MILQGLILFVRQFDTIQRSYRQRQYLKAQYIAIQPIHSRVKIVNMKSNQRQFIDCSSSNCKIWTKVGLYAFKHEKCNKTLCFWCAFQAYKQGLKKVNPKVDNKKKQTLQISLPCCKAPSAFELLNLQNFVVNKCPFDGEKCESKQKYECADGLSIGVECWDKFINNYKNNSSKWSDKYTQSQMMIIDKVKNYAMKKCNSCDNKIVPVIYPKYQFQKIFGICGNCYISQIKKQQKQTHKPNCCHQCGQMEVLEDIKNVKPKQGPFIVKKFNLAIFGQTLHCNFCIYKSWINVCDRFRQGALNFEQFIEYMDIIQTLFNERCLTCGVKVETKKNIFQFIDKSIVYPYQLNVILCGSCHMLVKDKQKVTKTLSKFKAYLIQTNQPYQSVIQSIKPTCFRQKVQKLRQFIKSIKQDKHLFQRQQSKFQQKYKSRELTKEFQIKDTNQKIQTKRQQDYKREQFRTGSKKPAQLRTKGNQKSQGQKAKPTNNSKIVSKPKNIRQIGGCSIAKVKYEIAKQKQPQKTKNPNKNQGIGLISRKKTTQSQGSRLNFKNALKKTNKLKITSTDSTNLQKSSCESHSRTQLSDQKQQSWKQLQQIRTGEKNSQYSAVQLHKEENQYRGFEEDTFKQFNFSNEHFHGESNWGNNDTQLSEITYPEEKPSTYLSQQSEHMQQIQSEEQTLHVSQDKTQHRDGHIYPTPEHSPKSSTSSLIEQMDLGTDKIASLIELKQQVFLPSQSITKQDHQSRQTNTPFLDSDRDMQLKLNQGKLQTLPSQNNNITVLIPSHQDTDEGQLPVNHNQYPNSYRQTSSVNNSFESYKGKSLELQTYPLLSQRKPLTKFSINMIDFDRKLEEISRSAVSSFPHLIQNLNFQIGFEQKTTSNTKRSSQSIRGKQKRSLYCQADGCKQGQDEFLFLQRYCTKCFNLLLMGKIPFKEVKRQQQQPPSYRKSVKLINQSN